MQRISQRFLHLLHLPFFYLQSVADLSKFAVPLIMNADTQWTLEPWHVKLALLRHGVTVEEESITLPEHKFSGPNEAYEGGEILISLKVELPDVMMNLVDQLYFVFQINDYETVNIRAIFFHQSIQDTHVVPPPGWNVRFYPSLLPDQAEALKMLPRHPLSGDDVANFRDGKEILEKYAAWKSARDKKLFQS